MIDNEVFKTAIVAELKEISALVAALPSAAEIRETQYQGDVFGYPNVRVRVVSNEPVARCYSRVQVGIQVDSEQQSSAEAEHISGIIARELNERCFTQTVNGNDVNTILRITNLMPALRVDERTWRSETLFTAIAS